MLWLHFFFNLKTTFFRLFEWVKVVVFYYRREIRFIGIECSLASHYLLKSPHRVSKAFLRRQGAKNIYGFGETPLTTLDKIARECQILSHDCVYELGCGSGRTCFWLRTFIRCRTVGIDYLPAFIEKAQRVKKWAQLTQIEFICADMLQADLSQASVIYLYGTCLEDPVIERLIHRFKQLDRQTKIITVSYPLTDYDPAFQVLKHFPVRFPWGKTDIFLNIRERP